MHEGEVSVRSEGLGKGSTFQIRLPQVPRPRTRAAVAAAVTVEPRRVLVVDDNADAADSLAMLLGVRGHETRVAYSAKDALTCAATFQPEVGILDIGLPELDGYELAKRLRAMPQMLELRLVALTGYGQVEDQQRALACGFDAHLVKPIDLATLERTLMTLSGTP
jgi:CheY-like chemotaxis protein